ncbi:cation transporter [Blautia obeum]|uniref:Cation transporter n=1 Tax=Blautia obeum TaxID=40520 RepID=A0A414ICV1_9FIRM|nr:cation diffusion facilitator family transporter [Blautia obeum]RGQ05298.1 cation transporter [Blautia obeum]RHB53193.1 cation transporter [Blautia obeum]RHE16050.1 cation transporter [Blautia obeum]RHH20360.1 cation transporter [Blautia obeum]RHL50620.1 cation transporter [Blautia obeum]
MITFLASLFIKDSKNYKEPSVRQAYGVLSGAVGIGLNILLFFGKWLAGTISGSIAIIADAFNNLSDAGSSIITLIGFRLSGQEPDPEHPFGHGRMEYISGLLVSVAILVMGFELIGSSIGKLRSPEPIESSALVFGILIASILVKLYMFFYNHSLSKKIESAAMKATSVDSLSDTVATTLVLIATLISKYTGLLLDGWFGILVGLFILYTGGSTLKETIDLLLGQPPKQEFIDEVKEIVLGHSMVHGVHDLIVHDYGPGRVMISLHAEVDVNGDIQDIHEQIDHIEHELQEKLHCSATIHMDPIVTDDKEVLAMKAKVEEMVHFLDESFSMHDFRMVKGSTRTNLIFDVEVPRKTSYTDNEIVNWLKERIHELPGSKYFAVIQIDHEYY